MLPPPDLCAFPPAGISLEAGQRLGSARPSVQVGLGVSSAAGRGHAGAQLQGMWRALMASAAAFRGQN